MSSQNRTKIIGLIAVVLLTTAGTAGAVAYNNRSVTQPDAVVTSTATTTPTTASTTTSSVDTSTPTATTSTPSNTTTYKDGTYSASGSFYTPDGNEQIGVKITLSSDKITAVSIDSSLIDNRESAQYTNRFTSGISAAVVGKNIKDVQVYRVSGASLTPIGFNTALETIKNDAKA